MILKQSGPAANLSGGPDIHRIKEKASEGNRMRILGKILGIPVVAALKVTGVLLALLVKLSAFLAGPFLVFTVGCGIYCIVAQAWKNLTVFAILTTAIIVIYLLAGLVLGVLDIVGKRIVRFIRL